MKKLIVVAVVFLIAPVSVWAALININTADISGLKEITGVGDVIAGRIIDYRTINGLFKTIEEIQNVKGIGGGVTYEKMKDEITVGDIESNSDPDPENNQQTIATSTTLNPGGGSVHTNQAILSNYDESKNFKVSAGRERLATVKTPIIFEVSRNKVGRTENLFRWSFGDGSSALGPKVSHAYQFPGHYNVVLNATIDQTEEASSRTTVLVTEPQIRITDINSLLGYVELTNDSDKEQNLNNWSLQSDDATIVYYLPLDTIIDPGSAIKIPLQFTDFNWATNREIILVYPGGAEGSRMTSAQADRDKVLALKKKLQELRQQLAERQRQNDGTKAVSSIPDKVEVSVEKENVVVLERAPSLMEKIKNVIFN